MRTKLFFAAATIAAAAVVVAAFRDALPSTTASISLGGIVKNPLILSAESLKNFQQVTVRMNSLGPSDEYHGAFIYTGVPLKYLLDLAHVEKEATDFFKPVDTLIIVKGAGGGKAVLSWAEVMYRQPQSAIIALAAEPVAPQKACESCHKKGEYEKWLAPLKKIPVLPRLILAGDAADIRCVEEVCSIVVQGPHLAVPKEKGKAHSPQFLLAGGGKKLAVKALPDLPRREVKVLQIGDGKGFHGAPVYQGVSLADLVKWAKISPAVEGYFVAAAPDGYRSVISAGELLLGDTGKEIIVADTVNGKEISTLGKFHLVVSGDLAADRWVKSLASIEYVPLKADPKLYIVGLGCGDTSLVTLEALSYIAKSDAVVCTKDIQSRYGFYLGAKKVLFDPITTKLPHKDKKDPSTTNNKGKDAFTDNQDKGIALIKSELAAGRSVAFLEYGDPAFWGSWTYWIREHFSDKELQLVPGVSALNAGNAMLAKNIVSKGSLVVTVPRGLKENEKLLEAVAKSGDTMAIFIGLKEMDTLLPLLAKYYPEKTPVAVAYKAGYSLDGKLLRTTLKDLQSKVSGEAEKFLGVIYIGDGAVK